MQSYRLGYGAQKFGVTAMASIYSRDAPTTFSLESAFVSPFLSL